MRRLCFPTLRRAALAAYGSLVLRQRVPWNGRFGVSADHRSCVSAFCGTGALAFMRGLPGPCRGGKQKKFGYQEDMEMSDRLANIRQEILDGMKERANSRAEAFELRKQFLDSRTGKIGQLMKEMKSIAPEERASFGKSVNELKEWAQQRFMELDEKMKERELQRRYESERIDVTMPARSVRTGNLHPVTQIRNQLMDIFVGMGFEVAQTREIEKDYYNFEALNIPRDHPARDMQDTFYLSPELLLATQTSAAQIHTMEKKKPPIKIVAAPGKVFRSDDDATHSPMFHQMEGLVVDKKITLCDLKGMLELFVKKIFGEDTTTRLRPSYFPFTEPSVEVDVSCFSCGGKGCKLCKGTGWIELLGAGIVNKKVLENCGIDSEQYSGLAFGIGLDRTAMLKYGIGNVKLLFESDLRVLQQIDDN